jgi:hypothetical protein
VIRQKQPGFKTKGGFKTLRVKGCIITPVPFKKTKSTRIIKDDLSAAGNITSNLKKNK